MSKPLFQGMNDRCPCDSGKKYKEYCRKKSSVKGKFMFRIILCMFVYTLLERPKKLTKLLVANSF